jgi:hypothetical protein
MRNLSTTKDKLTEQLQALKRCESALLRAAATHRAAMEALTDTLLTIEGIVGSERDPYPGDRGTRWLENHDLEEELRQSLPFADYAVSADDEISERAFAEVADRLWAAAKA